MKKAEAKTPAKGRPPIMSPPSFPPPNVSTIKDVENWLEFAEAVLEKASKRWIAARVATLLKGHYWVDYSEPESLTKAIARDWIVALARFSAWAIDAACIDWISKSGKAPKPFQIIEIAESHEIKVRGQIRRAREIIDPPPAAPRPDVPRDGPLSEAEKARLDACADFSARYLAERAAAKQAEPPPPEPPPRKASAASRAALRRVQLENPLMFPPDRMTAPQRAELAALRQWAKGEVNIPEGYEAREPNE